MLHLIKMEQFIIWALNFQVAVSLIPVDNKC